MLPKKIDGLLDSKLLPEIVSGSSTMRKNDLENFDIGAESQFPFLFELVFFGFNTTAKG